MSYYIYHYHYHINHIISYHIIYRIVSNRIVSIIDISYYIVDLKLQKLEQTSLR